MESGDERQRQERELQRRRLRRVADELIEQQCTEREKGSNEDVAEAASHPRAAIADRATVAFRPQASPARAGEPAYVPITGFRY